MPTFAAIDATSVRASHSGLPVSRPIAVATASLRSVSSAAKRPPENPILLRARKITRRFGGLVAVNAVDFEIPKGMIAAIIGPNGAGKTTFIGKLASRLRTEGKRVLVAAGEPEGARRDIDMALKTAGDDLSRDNIIKIAANLKELGYGG